MAEHSVLSYFIDAGPVVKAVMLILMSASVVSWTFIFQRAVYFQRIQAAMREFEEQFWSGADLTQLYLELKNQENEGMASIFVAGFKEFIRLQKQSGRQSPDVIIGMQRAMRIAFSREVEKLEYHLPFFASVGSVSPYIGLFGTVWGIMASLNALGSIQQATIAMVAPGISETLLATAMGLFAAIPAVLANNRFTNSADKLLNNYETFQEEFTSVVQRGASHETKA